MPDKGIIKIVPAKAGQIRAVLVRENQRVAKDAPLFEIDVSAVTTAGRTGDLVVGTLNDRLHLLEQELHRQIAVHASETARLKAQAASLVDQQHAAETELVSRRRVADLAQVALERNKTLLKKAVYSAAQMDKAEQEQLGNQAQVTALIRSLKTIEGDLEQAREQLRGLPDRQANERSRIERDVKEIKQQLLQVEDQRIHVVRAPEAGTVTRIAALGSAVEPSTPLATIIPDDTQLEANLYVPSRAAGFIALKTPVMLRYEAYPYEKFGIQMGRVTAISRTSVSGRELPVPVQTDEPLYVVTAVLDKQTMSAFGREEPLASGARFQADMVLEDRKIWEWLVEPLLAAKAGM